MASEESGTLKIDMERQHLAPDQTQSNSRNSSERTPEPSVRSIPCSRQILSEFYNNAGTPEPDEQTARKLKQLEKRNSTDSSSSLKDADQDDQEEETQEGQEKQRRKAAEKEEIPRLRR